MVWQYKHNQQEDQLDQISLMENVTMVGQKQRAVETFAGADNPLPSVDKLDAAETS